MYCHMIWLKSYIRPVHKSQICIVQISSRSFNTKTEMNLLSNRIQSLRIDASWRFRKINFLHCCNKPDRKNHSENANVEIETDFSTYLQDWSNIPKFFPRNFITWLLSWNMIHKRRNVTDSAGGFLPRPSRSCFSLPKLESINYCYMTHTVWVIPMIRNIFTFQVKIAIVGTGSLLAGCEVGKFAVELLIQITFVLIMWVISYDSYKMSQKYESYERKLKNSKCS